MFVFKPFRWIKEFKSYSYKKIDDGIEGISPRGDIIFSINLSKTSRGIDTCKIEMFEPKITCTKFYKRGQENEIAKEALELIKDFVFSMKLMCCCWCLAGISLLTLVGFTIFDFVPGIIASHGFCGLFLWLIEKEQEKWNDNEKDEMLNFLVLLNLLGAGLTVAFG